MVKSMEFIDILAKTARSRKITKKTHSPAGERKRAAVRTLKIRKKGIAKVFALFSKFSKRSLRFSKKYTRDLAKIFTGATSVTRASLAVPILSLGTIFSLIALTLAPLSSNYVVYAAPQVHEFTADISPSTVVIGQTQTYAITITNSPSSTKKIKSGEITIPSGFSINLGSVIKFEGATAADWEASSTASNIIFSLAPGSGNSGIDAGDFLKISFEATANSGTGSFVLTTDSSTNNSFSPGSGGDFTNTSSPPTVTIVSTTGTLHIIKHVVNDNGGTASAGDWTMDVSATNPSQASFDGGESGTDVTVDPGDYSVSESGGPDGYTGSSSADCSGSIAAGETKNCTITNDDIGGTLVIEKHTIGGFDNFGFSVSNENGENPGLGSFDLETDSESNPAIQSFFDVFADIYSIVEDFIPEGWDLTSATCDKDNPVSEVSVGLNETVTCTFENTARGQIIVEKDTIPNDDTSFHFNASYDGDGFDIAGGQSNSSDLLVPGTYSVSEAPNNDYITTAVCSDGSDPGSITLSPGEIVTCTFTNTIKQAGLTIVKVTNPPEVDQSFDFELSWDEGGLTLEGGNSENFDLEPGTYSVNEINIPEDWEMTNATCSDGSDPSSIGLDPDEAVVCTFTNTQLGKIIVDKVTNPEESSQEFTFDPSYGEGSFTLTDTQTPDDSGYLDPGTYSVDEIDIPTGWELTSAVCDDGSDPSEIALGAGEIVTCTFTNTFDNNGGNNGGGGEENTPPVITLNGASTIDLTVGDSFSDPGATASDAEDGDLTSSITTSSTVDTGTAGTYMVTYSVEDTGGLTDTKTRTVNVNAQQSNGGGEENNNDGGGGGGGPIETVAGGPSLGGGALTGPGEVLGANVGPAEVLGESTCNVGSEAYLKDYMRQGMKNDSEQVIKLQEFLNKNLGLSLPSSGFFGSLTTNAVNQFQLKYKKEVLLPWVAYGLPNEDTPTGYVYKTTRRWINMLECPALNLPIPPLP
ncbi:MAG: DUF5011 domain-containing protein [Candidatus Liptonbacteria bacterium]|nr:DUF5011 domain-containing protein [Candidatus Liptonbacteria bacterium]